MDTRRLRRGAGIRSLNTPPGRIGVTAFASMAWLMAALTGTAEAQTNLVTNGSFAVTGGSTSFQFGTYNSYAPTETLAGWSSTGYNFVFLPGSINVTGTYGSLSLWSPSSSPASANGFNNESPTGGNFIAADSDYGTEPITQTINGLTVGTTYAVSFAWAAAQQTTYTTASTDAWIVDLGSSPTQETQVYNLPSEGFSGWMNQTFDFVATSSSEVLSFLATGGPAGVPPFALLANVSMTVAPEPSGIAVLASGIAGLMALAWYRHAAGPKRL
jgi:hypothetical protein